MVRRYVTFCAFALALLTAGCAGQSSARLAADTAPPDAAATALAADLRPLHAEAVLLADLVLSADPDDETAELVRQVRAASAASLEEADRALAGAAAPTAGALSASELEALRDATGARAVALGLQGLFRNSLDTVARAKAEVSRSAGGSARALADRVLSEHGPLLERLPAA